MFLGVSRGLDSMLTGSVCLRLDKPQTPLGENGLEWSATGFRNSPCEQIQRDEKELQSLMG